MNKFQNIVRMQYDLNTHFSGPGWIFNPDVDAPSAIREEADELAKSAGWKPWWKSGEAPIDYDNCQLETVDIYHFHITAMLQEAATNLATDLLIEANESENDLDELEGDLDEDFDFSSTVLTQAQTDLVVMQVAQFLEQAAAVSVRPLNGTRPYKHVNDYLGEVLYLGAIASSVSLFRLAASWGMNPELLNTLYLAKNALNHFRASNNYKGERTDTPKYVKIWANGKEDNYFVMLHMRSLIEKGKEINSDEIYSTIAQQYQFYTGITPTPTPAPSPNSI